MGNAQAGSEKWLAVEVEPKFQDCTWPGTITCRLVICSVPVLLIVIETIPPPFHVDESANEIPARQFPVVAGVPLVAVVLVLVWAAGVAGVVPVEVLVEVELELELELELEVELELELELTLGTEGVEGVEGAEGVEELAEHPVAAVAHSQLSALEQVGEPPDPQGTWR